MEITMTKSYHKFLERDYFNIYGYPNNLDTKVFWEYYDVLRTMDLKREELKEFIRTYKPTSKSRASVYVEDTRILFCKPNRSVFPVFYVEFK